MRAVLAKENDPDDRRQERKFWLVIPDRRSPATSQFMVAGGIMDSGFRVYHRAATSGRTRWLGPGTIADKPYFA